MHSKFYEIYKLTIMRKLKSPLEDQITARSILTIIDPIKI
mgnify:FL=1|jgi:hypothetical protein